MSSENHFAYLRARALSLGPVSTIGVKPNAEGVYAFITESTLEGATATLVDVADGALSFYFSNGSGVIGAGQLPEIRGIALPLLDLAHSHLHFADLEIALELPLEGRTKFYLVTEDGVRSRNFATAELSDELHPFALLHSGAQLLLGTVRTQLLCQRVGR